jgi:DNA-binding transcriptional MerR regulator
LTDDTLRYYEREGLVGAIDRDASSHRCYGDNDV